MRALQGAVEHTVTTLALLMENSRNYRRKTAMRVQNSIGKRDGSLKMEWEKKLAEKTEQDARRNFRNFRNFT